MFPAIIIVAPNSPKALVKESIAPPNIDCQLFGSITFQNIQFSDLPNVLAAFIILVSICSKAPLLVLYISGKETIKEASIAPLKVNIKGKPNFSTMLPIKEFLPKNISKKNPTTVGGSTKGRVNTISNIDENLFILKTAKAIYIPTKKVIMVE